MRKALHGSVSPTLKESALLSSGEGQRVRLGRTLQRKQARLVILDEPFRGVDSLEVRRARKALAPITSSSAFYSKMATTRRISLPLPYPEPSPSVVLAKPTRLWWNAKSGRSRLNHDVAIVERRSFDRAKTNLVEQDLYSATLRSVPFTASIRESGSRSLSTKLRVPATEHHLEFVV